MYDTILVCPQKIEIQCERKIARIRILILFFNQLKTLNKKFGINTGKIE